jgi:hypothetical protein
MTTTSGTLNTFGDALNNMGFWGASNINPNNMQNNCVSVSVAHMEYYTTVEDFWRDIYNAPLPDQPLNLWQIEDMIRRTQYQFRWVEFKSGTIDSQHVTAYDLLRFNFPARGDGGSKGPRGRPLALYKRRDGSGHCVTAAYELPEAVGTPGHPRVVEGEPTEFTFQDWQHGEGVDCAWDVMAADSIIIGYQAEFLGSVQEYNSAIDGRIARMQAGRGTGSYDY